MNLAIGIITLFLTAFVLAFYGYINRHSDVADVSFFMATCLISMVMNLCTNAAGGGATVLSWLYLAVDVLFLVLGFAVSVEHTLGFYKSIGPWLSNIFSNAKLLGWQLLSLLVCPAGFALYFVWGKTEKEELALECGKLAAWGVLLWILLLWTILGIAL